MTCKVLTFLFLTIFFFRFSNTFFLLKIGHYILIYCYRNLLFCPAAAQHVSSKGHRPSLQRPDLVFCQKSDARDRSLFASGKVERRPHREVRQLLEGRQRGLQRSVQRFETRSTLSPAMTTAVAQRYSTCLQSNTLEVVCSMPAGCWAFSSIFIPRWRVLNQVPRGGATLLIFPLKDGCLAVKLGA